MKKNANILLRMHQKEARAGITRVGVDGALGKFCKIFYIIAFAYTMGINLIYTLSIWMNSNHVIESIGKGNLTVFLYLNRKNKYNNERNGTVNKLV